MARAANGHFSVKRAAPVAQLDRAPDYESGGQEFESLRARQDFKDLTCAAKVPGSLSRRSLSAVCVRYDNQSVPQQRSDWGALYRIGLKRRSGFVKVSRQHQWTA